MNLNRVVTKQQQQQQLLQGVVQSLATVLVDGGFQNLLQVSGALQSVRRPKLAIIHFFCVVHGSHAPDFRQTIARQDTQVRSAETVKKDIFD